MRNNAYKFLIEKLKIKLMCAIAGIIGPKIKF